MKILFIDTVHPFLIESLRREGHECIEGYGFDVRQIKDIIKNVQGIVIRSRIKIDKEILDIASELLFIARVGAGMENIDVAYAESRNIKCLSSPEGNRDAVGEHAVGMLLSLMNNLNRADRQVRMSEWRREENRGHELQGKTVAIIGYGQMGSSFALKLRGFDCRVLAYDKYKSGFGDAFAKESSMDEIYSSADILSIHLPLTQETDYMIDDAFINRFSKDFYFINTARGRCVKTEDLVKNIKSGKISGACLDVIEYEDNSFESISGKKNDEMWQYLISSDKVILTPHIAGWSFESNEKMARILFQKIVSLK